MVTTKRGRGISARVLAVSAAVAMIGVAAPGRATSELELISVSVDGSPGNGQSAYPSISFDGRYVAFDAEASDLVVGDSNGSPDIFVRDRVTNTTVIASVSSTGAPGNFASEFPSISNDGRRVAFVSGASTLVPGDMNGTFDIFVRDRDADADGVFDEPGGVSTTRASVSTSGAEGDDWSLEPSLSGDGRSVAFLSYAGLVAGDADIYSDIFVRDLTTGTTKLVSISSDGSKANHSSSYPSISLDGRFVAFASVASNLVPGDTNDDQDVFLHDRDADADGVFDEPGSISTELISVGDGGGSGNGGSFQTAISDDGSVVAFVSTATNLVPGDGSVWDVFVRDVAAGVTQKASVSSQGEPANENSTHPSLSGNGRLVAFHSMASTLVAGDDNTVPGWAGGSDAFVRDRLTGVTALASLTSDGDQGNNHSEIASLSGDGTFVAFASRATNFAPNDDNDAHDVFMTQLDIPSDPTPPDTTILAGPSGTVTASTATFSFSADEPDSRFRCSLDGSPFGVCNSPVTYSGLVDGAHEFRVAARDPSGNVDPTPASRSWIVDAVGPEVTIIRPGPGLYVCDQPVVQPTGPPTVVAGGVTFETSARDPQSAIMEFSYSVDGVPIGAAQVTYDPGAGVYRFRYEPGLGRHEVTATATNGSGITSAVTVAVLAVPLAC